MLTCRTCGASIGLYQPHKCPGLQKPKSDPLRAALVAIQELHKPSQIWHERYTAAGILVSATVEDGPCVICNPTVTDVQHCDDCTNDGLEGGDPDSWCEGVHPIVVRTPWPCPTRRLADDALGGGKHG